MFKNSIKKNFFIIIFISILIVFIAYLLYFNPSLARLRELKSRNAEIHAENFQLEEKIKSDKEYEIRLRELKKKYNFYPNLKKIGMDQLLFEIKKSSLRLLSFQNESDEGIISLVCSGKFAALFHFLENLSLIGNGFSLKKMILKKSGDSKENIDIQIQMEKNHY